MLKAKYHFSMICENCGQEVTTRKYTFTKEKPKTGKEIGLNTSEWYWIDKDGNYTFRHGSSQVFVSVTKWTEDNSLVRVYSPTNFKITPSKEFYKYIATESNKYVFGRLSIQEQSDGIVVLFSQSMLGESLDPDELKMAITIVATTAEDIDNTIQDKFGGETYYRESN